MTILGVVALPGVPPERLSSLAAVAEGVGLDELWLWEDCFYAGSVAAAATMLAVTSRLHVGIGVQPVPLRAAPLAAMELAALDRIAPGRLVAGLGHGVQEWMGQVGVRVESPLTLLREYTVALRALLAGDEVTVQGRYVRLDRVRLAWPPARRLPLHFGTEGPRSLRLSGELADGTILPGGTTPDRVRAVRAVLDEGRRAAGRQDPHRLTVYVGPFPELDAQPVADAVRALTDAGADAVVLLPRPPDERSDPDDEAFVRFVAGVVRPLL
jgi:alkanesulfonate monooxygenase SsuD/methylene tetrahydromethanopterin reductase-like flavin-dependent oxidoreductase (luciferase family)